MHDSFYKKNNFIDSNSNCLFQNTFVPLRSIKIQNYTYPFSHNEKEKERGKYSYTNLFSPILRAFARCVLRGDDGGDDSKGTRETSSGVSTSCCLERAPRAERGVGKKKRKKLFNASTCRDTEKFFRIYFQVATLIFHRDR